MNATDLLGRLRLILQDGIKPAAFEELAAASVGRLLGVTVAVARSGFQHGGDAGPSGRQDRRFRLEAKRYADSTALGERELLGEMDHALARDPALEAWILVATREASEQLEQSLTLHGERLGVPVLILDWKARGFPALAALCAFAPDLVTDFAGDEAGSLARALGDAAEEAIATLRRDLRVWSLGFDSVRAACAAELGRLWGSPTSCRSALGQDAAGGARRHKVRRQAVGEHLSRWWASGAGLGAPALLVGREGVGKTWAALDWAVERLDDLPIVLAIPAAAFAGEALGTKVAVKRFLAGRLHERTETRDVEHWLRRLDHMLRRPLEEGPLMTVLVDGLNQEPSINWTSVLRVLQDGPLSGRIAVVVTTRGHHFSHGLSSLRGLVVPPVVVRVENYDTSPGGEFDRMLAFEDLTRSEVHPDLVPLATNPRLFALVIRFRDRLVEAGQVTVHRLLWEYGRDTLGVRAGVSFSEEEWREWLREIAARLRAGTTTYDLRTLGETAARSDLAPTQVQIRLGDLIDGEFVTRSPSGDYVLPGHVVAHALGAALLARLDEVSSPTIEVVEAELHAWLDPIEALDGRSEILRAAVSILVERDKPSPAGLSSALVTAWLQAQNLPDSHRGDAGRMASRLVAPLLDAIERSGGDAQRSARLCAVNAVRAIRKDDRAALALVVARAARWLATVSREVGRAGNGSEHFAEERAARLRDRVGVERSGTFTILGQEVEFVDRLVHRAAVLVPSLLEGFPLASAIPALRSAALTLAICGRSDPWNGLEWLCLLNETDPVETAEALRDEAATIVGLDRGPGSGGARSSGSCAASGCAAASASTWPSPSRPQLATSSACRSYWLNRRWRDVRVKGAALPTRRGCCSFRREGRERPEARPARFLAGRQPKTPRIEADRLNVEPFSATC